MSCDELAQAVDGLLAVRCAARHSRGRRSFHLLRPDWAANSRSAASRHRSSICMALSLTQGWYSLRRIAWSACLTMSTQSMS